jgi:hypothetical protein
MTPLVDSLDLHVVSAYSNPLRWKSRLRTFQDYEQHMVMSGARLTTVECAYGEKPFELGPVAGINRVQVRAKTMVWNKENLINLGISRLPGDWKYVAWIDGDVTFRKVNWVEETLNALQHYDFVQPWSDAYDLGPNDEHLQHHQSFCKQYWHDKPVRAHNAKWWTWNGGPYTYPHSGYAWAASRHALEWVGGLIETGISGAGDHHMALGLVGEAKYSLPGGVTEGYCRPIYQWQSRAMHHINRNIGFIWGTLEHTWHGRKVDRKYVDRWKIIVDNKFDPATDLKKNVWGVLELAGNKPKLTHEIDRYFHSRNEDANTIS